jgi:hypothetical protein
VYQGGQQFAEFANPSIFQEVATDGRKILLPKVVPFMSQRAREPNVFCQRTSALPSPLKSLFMARCAEDTILKTISRQEERGHTGQSLGRYY